ncbi:hypothetical protein GCM10009646_68550 [Streptomyces aureus]
MPSRDEGHASAHSEKEGRREKGIERSNAAGRRATGSAQRGGQLHTAVATRIRSMARRFRNRLQIHMSPKLSTSQAPFKSEELTVTALQYHLHGPAMCAQSGCSRSAPPSDRPTPIPYGVPSGG